jgi:radical SAM superfamily enzyme YgiQ (UPF0313 family)
MPLKVTLINPPDITVVKRIELKKGFSIGTPLGLAYIGAVLQKSGYEVKIIDCVGSKLKWNKISSLLEKSSPHIVGVTTTTPTLLSAIEIARKSKELFPNIPVVFGGHGTFKLGSTILKRINEVDVIVHGEGEQTILELVRAIGNNLPLQKVSGISFRKKSREIRTIASRPFIQDLDSLPFPARHLLPMKSYIRDYFPSVLRKESFKGTVLVSSRGCPFSCLFCAATRFYGHKWRARSPQNVVDEIEHLYNNYRKLGLNGFYLGDDNFLVDPKRVCEICNLLIERGLSNLGWICQARVDSADLKLYSKMYEAGCRMLELGIESGNDQILRIIRKGITKNVVRNAVKIAKSVGLKTFGYFMLGLPGDTYETMMDTIQFAEELDLDAVQFNPTFIFPGTEMGKEKDIDWLNFLIQEELFTNPLPRTELHPCVPTYQDRQTMIEMVKYAMKRLKIKRIKRKRLSSLVLSGVAHPRKAVRYLIDYLKAPK